MSGTAILSPCELYRYTLTREGLCAEGPAAAIIGVNPSTATATVNDATIRKDIGFAERNGWRRIIKGNLFAYRSTDIKALAVLDYETAVGPDNNKHLTDIFQEADVLVAAWGPTAKLPVHLRPRWRDMVQLAAAVKKPLMCFGTVNDGQPRHTLMIPYSTPLIEWSPPE